MVLHLDEERRILGVDSASNEVGVLRNDIFAVIHDKDASDVEFDIVTLHLDKDLPLLGVDLHTATEGRIDSIGRDCEGATSRRFLDVLLAIIMPSDDPNTFCDEICRMEIGAGLTDPDIGTRHRSKPLTF